MLEYLLKQHADGKKTSGYMVSRALNYKSGLIYPMLHRLKAHGFLGDCDGPNPVRGRIRSTLYWLTPLGEKYARATLDYSGGSNGEGQRLRHHRGEPHHEGGRHDQR